MQRSVMIVDDFLTEPERFREAAARMDFPEQDGNFPGRNSLQRLDLPELDKAVENLVGQKLRPLRNLSHGKFRLTLAGDIGRGKVHLDDSQWSGILYLSLPEHCEGGTEFFRHKATGTESLLLRKNQMDALGWAGPDEANAAISDIIERDGTRDEAWEPTLNVPMRYNRLLLLRPWQWHTAGPGFGTSLEDGRLVFLLFYARA